MTTFDDREKAFEAKFAHDAEMAFKAIARRDKALAHWAAGLLGKTAEQTRDYEATLVREDVDNPEPDAILEILLKDLEGVADEATIRERMAEYLRTAKAELAELT